MPRISYDGLWFGRKPPEDVSVTCAWGCRAILTGRGDNQYIDLLPDRRQFWSAPDTDTEAFKAWLTGAFNKWLEGKCGQGWIDPGSDEVFTLDAAPFHATACANKSYGYLYVGAWMTETKPA